MERKVVIICAVVGFLGVLSTALGFAAEAKRIKATQVIISPGVCSYPTSRSPAFALGMTAAIALMVSQGVITTGSGYMCCQRNPNTSTTYRTLALVSFIISWFAFVIAFLLLLTGVALNYQHGKVYLSSYYCYVFKPGAFTVAAVLSHLSADFGIVHYLLSDPTITSSRKSAANDGPNQSGIAMGQPQVSPISQDPVFVHEDTYMRRQFP